MRRPSLPVLARATVAVAALYGLLLAGLLGSLAPALPSGLAALCASAEGSPAPAKAPDGHDRLCPTAACPLGGGLPAPPPDGTALALTHGQAVAIRWSAPASLTPVASRPIAFRPRGPPLA